jgi:poly-D-alanine transfer protein DltD
MATTNEWNDFNLLLSDLKETGAQPLIPSRPMNGTILNLEGDSSDQDSNRLFSVDQFSHTSRVGWIYVDQALDVFYHIPD